MAVEQTRITLEEFLDLPEEKPALEYVDGAVVQKVPPSTPHSALQYDFCALVNNYARPRRLAWAFPEHRTTYAGRSTVPDVTVYTCERVPRDAARRLSTRNLTPPDIAVEPTGLLLVVLRLAAEPLVFENDGAVDLTDVIPGFSLDVGALLAPLGPDWSPDEGEE